MELKGWKMIKVRAETYEMLRAEKGPGETFDAVIRRMADARRRGSRS
jgi:predicted CopG family antitoxin